MNLRPRHLLFLIAGLLLLLGPWFMRAVVLDYNGRAYTPPDVPVIDLAATPAPTVTPVPVATPAVEPEPTFRTRPVVVDLAHLNRISRSAFQPLEAALAARHVGLRFWQPETSAEASGLDNFLDFPDQSERLAAELADASALVVVSPFFLWSPKEIALVEQFVADGGRLLVISDPDVTGDAARDIDNLTQPFGLVFNDDYLYDTEDNDGNFIHIFAGEFLDQASQLEGRRIALYGARSISGSGEPQVRSAESTLSSLRTGLSGFTVAAIGGKEARGTAGRVLALGDFDTLTEPYIERHDNRDLLGFVADFLAGAEFAPTIDKFPAFLGKEVSLLYGSEQALGATLLVQGARLQDRLALSGRTLALADKDVLTATLSLDADAAQDASDLIYLADFITADAETPFLDSLGFSLLTVVVTPTMPLTTSAVAALPAPPELSKVISAASVTVTVGAKITSTATSTTTELAPLPAVEPTPPSAPAQPPEPRATTYLETGAGIRFLADEVVLIGQRELDSGVRLVILLAADSTGVSDGVERLLAQDFGQCILEPDQAICPLEAGDSGSMPETAAPATAETPQTTAESPGPAVPESPSPADQGRVLVIDDNSNAQEGEVSEADTFIKRLVAAGESPRLWVTSAEDVPDAETLMGYRWVIWSGSGYKDSGPYLEDLGTINAYVNQGGRLTISSRAPLLGMATAKAAPIRDLVVDPGGQAMNQDLPGTAIELADDLPPVHPLDEHFLDTVDASVVLRRGPMSKPENAPALLYFTDADAEEPMGAQIAVMGLSLTWLPEDVQAVLVRNMAAWMLEE